MKSTAIYIGPERFRVKSISGGKKTDREVHPPPVLWPAFDPTKPIIKETTFERYTAILKDVDEHTRLAIDKIYASNHSIPFLSNGDELEPFEGILTHWTYDPPNFLKIWFEPVKGRKERVYQ